MVGCVKPVNRSNEGFPTPSLTVTRETIRVTQTNSTLISTPTQLVKNTPSPTLKPTYTSSFTPTLLPTSTPRPTLSPEEAEKLVLSLFENNGGCELPCWWGITPGVTTLQEAQDKIPILVPPKPYYKGKGITITGFNIPVPVDKDPLGIGEYGANIYIQDNLVFAIGTNTGRIKSGMDTSLAGLLKVFGPPDEIWINMEPTGPNNQSGYEIELFYSKIGILFNGTGLADIHGSFVRFCPYKFRRGNFPPAITLFSTLLGFTYESLTDILFNREVSDLSKFRLLRDFVDGMDETVFYNIYLNPTAQECLDVQREKLQ
jgi:hypothetical protein